MDTKQDKIIAFISAALAAIILIVVIACNVVNDSSDVNLESESNESVVDVKDVIEDANASLSGAIGITVGVNLETEEETTEECWRPGFNPWVGKIPWRAWQPTPVLPGESPWTE